MTARQVDALREVVHQCAARAATTLAKLVGEGGVLVDVPVLVQAAGDQLAVLLGGVDRPVLAARFGIDGPVAGTLWWVLAADDAKRLGSPFALDYSVTFTFVPR